MLQKLRNFYVNILVPFSVFVLIAICISPLITVPAVLMTEHRYMQDQRLAATCQAVSLGDTVQVDSVEITIGTAYATGYRTVGGKGLKVEYHYYVTSLFVNGVPVRDFHGYRLIANSQGKHYFCSPTSIQELR